MHLISIAKEFDDTVGYCNTYYSNINSDAGSFGENPFEDVETRSRFTAYSMTSSVIRRNDGLTLLDDRFEKVKYPSQIKTHDRKLQSLYSPLDCQFSSLYDFY